MSRTSHPLPRSPDLGLQQRVELLEARVEHLDAAVELLQDAVCRQPVAQDENIAELRSRTELERMARDLSRSAGKHGS